jgi:protein-disulfide isomerase
VAKSEKKAAVKSSSAKAAEAQAAPATSNLKTIIIGAVAAAALIAGILYWRAGSDAGPVRTEKKDVPVSELMAPGPLEDLFLGQADAPNTIVEYASMTCSHCARFHTDVLPELEKKYIETGQARLVLREFPLDGLATAAFMLARCSGDDRYYPMVDALFETQQSWVVQGGEAKEKLFAIAKQAGFSREKFDQCLADKELFNKIVETRKIAHEKFGVDSTPSFFVNGKRLTGEHQLKDFDALLGGGEAAADGPASAAGESPAEPEATPAE